MGWLTVLDGEGILIREATRYALVEGISVLTGDIIEMGVGAQYGRVEFTDGSSVGLGPAARAQLSPGLTGERAAAQRVYLLSGWAKISAGKTPVGMATRNFDLTGISGNVVLQLTPTATALFVEGGLAMMRTWNPPRQPIHRLQDGEFVVPATARSKLVTTKRPTPAFLQALPKSFLDSPPPRAAQYSNRDVRPRRAGEPTYVDLKWWINGEPALRKANLSRFLPLANNPEFRKGIQAEMKQHPEWEAAIASLP